MLVTDVNIFFTRVKVHRHKVNTHPTNFKVQENDKARMIIDKLEEMVVGFETTLGANKIYDNKTAIYWEKYPTGQYPVI